MSVALRSAQPPRYAAWLFVILLAVGLGAAWYVMSRTPDFSREAVIRAGVGHDLLNGLPRGRQGLVGSFGWAPMPTLMGLPMLRLPEPFGGLYAFTFMAMAAVAALCAFLNEWLRRCGVRGGVRFAVTLIVFLSPAIRQPAMHGGSGPFFALMGMATMVFLLHWWETEQLRSLAYLAVTVAVAVLTRYQGLILFLGALVVVLVHLLLRPARKHYAEATLIIFLIPPLYAIGLWMTANWLIMGDAFFFLRGLAEAVRSPAGLLELLAEGVDWRLVTVLTALPLLAWALYRGTRGSRALWLGLPTLAASFVLWSGGVVGATPRPTPADAELAQVVAHVNSVRRHDWVIVSGYRGYEVAEALPGHGRGQLQHVLSFYLDPVLRDTVRRRTYLLVPKPEGADRWEDINLKYPRLYAQGGAFTVYEKTWPHWRLLRIVRVDETDRR
jgi:hypothetical protein